MDSKRVEEIADEIVHQVKAEGRTGGTIRVSGDDPHPTTGYYVGGAVPSLKISTGYVRALLRVEITYWLLDRQPASEYIGFWCYQGRLYVDATNWFSDRDTAISAGIRRNELAIYDIKRGVEIDL